MKLFGLSKEEIDFWRDGLKPKKRGGFRKIAEPRENICQHPNHNPPGHIVLGPGTYEYTCPGCGASQIVRVPLIRN